MSSKIVIANWKMNPQTLDEARVLVSSWQHRARSLSDRTTVAVAAPFVFLPALSHYLKEVKLGAQNLSWAEQGALTGEISADQLKEWKVEYVILGHSERRLYLGETDSVVNAKLIAALKNKLTPVLCLGGETGAIKNEMQTLVTKQFIACTHNLDESDLAKIIYVYEPVWAISTMKNSQAATGEHAAEMVDHIYKLLEHRIGKKSQHIKVIYGGTVNQDNVGEYAQHPQIGGALVGAASLDVDNFWRVVEEFDRESVHRL